MLRQRYSKREAKLREYLKLKRKERGLSQVELAEAFGAPQSFISKYELGERYLTFCEVLDVCQILEVDVSELIKAIED